MLLISGYDPINMEEGKRQRAIFNQLFKALFAILIALSSHCDLIRMYSWWRDIKSQLFT